MPAAYSAGMSRFELADRGFHLDADKSSGLTNDEVVAAHFSPGLARGQAVLGGARHKNRLRPLAAQFLVLDDFRLARFHPPRTEKSSIRQKSLERRPILRFDRNENSEASTPTRKVKTIPKTGGNKKRGCPIKELE